MITTLITVSFICIIVSLIVLVFLFCNDRTKENTKISFKEGLDLTELPIATFNCNGNKLHFLLDTGSNISYIDKRVLKTLPHESTNTKSNTIGVEGSGVNTYHYKVTIGYKDNEFTEEFGAIDFTNSFDIIEKESGIKLHGILGSRFFEKYKYILDFKELAAYR